MTEKELAEIKDRANRAYDFYPLTPNTTNWLCSDIFKLLKEVERLQSVLDELSNIADTTGDLDEMLEMLE